MSADLSSLFQLLRNLEGEVHGRQSSRPPADIENRIRDFLAGQLSTEARLDLCQILRSKPEWLAWMAEEVRNPRRAES